jgi:hypothetical protein
MVWNCLCERATKAKPGLREMVQWDDNYSKVPLDRLRLAICDTNALDGMFRWPDRSQRHGIADHWYEMIEQCSTRGISYYSDSILSLWYRIHHSKLVQLHVNYWTILGRPSTWSALENPQCSCNRI